MMVKDRFERCSTLDILQFFFECVLIPAVIVFLAWNSNSFHGIVDPLEAGQYLASTNAVSSGQIPYRDFIPPVGPLYIWSLCAFFAIAGKTVYALCLYFQCFTAATYLMVYLLSLRLLRNKILAWMLPFVVLVETLNPFWASRWAGYSRAGLGLVAIFFLIIYIEKRRLLHLFLAGAMSGMAVIYSIDAGFFSILASIIAIFLLSLKDCEPVSSKCFIDIRIPLLAFVSGCGLVLGIFATYMAINGGLLPYLEATYLIATNHVSAWQTHVPTLLDAYRAHDSLWRFFISDGLKVHLPGIFYIFMILYLMMIWRNKVDTLEKRVTLTALTIYGILSFKSGSRVYLGPQFSAGLYPFFILLFVVVERCFCTFFSDEPCSVRIAFFSLSHMRSVFKRAATASGIAALVIIILAAGFIGFSKKRYYVSWSGWLNYQMRKHEQIPFDSAAVDMSELFRFMRNARLESFGPILLFRNEADKMELMAEQIRQKTLQDERVFTFPELALYNFLSDRPAFTRFNVAVYAHTVPAWQQEILYELKAAPPRYILYSKKLSNVARNIGHTTELLPDVVEYIRNNYKIEVGGDEIGLYRRK